MDYEKAYKEALAKMREIITMDDKPTIPHEIAYHLFPELKESEDERIRKELLEHCKNQAKPYSQTGNKCPQIQSWIAWLEKQNSNVDNANKEYWRGYREGKQEILDKYAELEKQRGEMPADKVKPKFKVGDWVTNGLCAWRIDSIDEDMYYTNHCGIDCGGDIKSIDEEYHIWTIQDAEDGDVLCDYHEAYDNPLIFILKKFEHVYFGLTRPSDYSSYCFLTASDRQRFKEGTYHHEHNIRPATKEQRDLLFQKMHEAGYEWDAEKKELRKIEQEPAWTEDDENILNDMKDTIKECWNGDTRDILLDWFETIKQRIKGE